MLRIRLNRRLPARLRIKSDSVPLRLRGIEGETLYVRPGTSDLEMVAYDYAYGFHKPPPEIAGDDMGAIIELGSCAGAALAWYGQHYPHATVIGVEPDPGNVAIARRNIERFGKRVQILDAGIWSKSTDLTIEFVSTHGSVVRERTPSDGPDMPTIPALSMPDLLEAHLPDGPIDFLNITVEGAERHVLDPTADWPTRVRAIRIELQQDKDFFEGECVRLLEEMGFECSVHYQLGGYVLGLRA